MKRINRTYLALFPAIATAAFLTVGCDSNDRHTESTDAPTHQTTSGFEQAGEGMEQGFKGIGNTVEEGVEEPFEDN